MSDIFREVEEEVRRDRLEKIWKEYGDYIVAAVALVILAAAAYRLWTYYEARERARASEHYLAAQQLLQSGQAQPAAKAFAQLTKSAPSGYSKLSQLQEAAALAAAGNKGAALAIYRKAASDRDEMLSSIARIRAAWILVEGAPKSEVESMLGPLADKASPWAPVAHEIIAYADYHSGATAKALTEFRALAQNKKAPPGVRGRSNAMATFLTAGGAKDVGHVAFPETPVVPLNKAPGATPNNAAAPAGSVPPAGSPGAAPGTPANATPPAAPATTPTKPASPAAQQTAAPTTPDNPKGPSPK